MTEQINDSNPGTPETDGDFLHVVPQYREVAP